MTFNLKTFEMKEESVNNAIRICIKLGSRSVVIDNYGIYCKDCNSKFRMEGED